MKDRQYTLYTEIVHRVAFTLCVPGHLLILEPGYRPYTSFSHVGSLLYGYQWMKTSNRKIRRQDFLSIRMFS